MLKCMLNLSSYLTVAVVRHQRANDPAILNPTQTRIPPARGRVCPPRSDGSTICLSIMIPMPFLAITYCQSKTNRCSKYVLKYEFTLSTYLASIKAVSQKGCPGALPSSESPRLVIPHQCTNDPATLNPTQTRIPPVRGRVCPPSSRQFNDLPEHHDSDAVSSHNLLSVKDK